MARPPLFVTPNYSLSILPFLSVVASTCYCVRDSVVFDCSSTESACGGASSVDSGAQLCCVNGDQCGKDSICHFTKSIPNTSGYYLGGCTHPTYQDQVCQRHCIDAGTADIVFNTTSGLWSCCGYPDNTVSCQNPRANMKSPAITPDDFPGTISAATSSTTSTPSTSTSSLPASLSISTSGTKGAAGAVPATMTANVSQDSSSGLSTGATAGISVAAVLVALGVIAGLVFIFMRRRRTTTEADRVANTNIPGYLDAGYSNDGSGHVRGMSDIHTRVKELDSTNKSALAQLYGSETREVSEMP